MSDASSIGADSGSIATSETTQYSDSSAAGIEPAGTSAPPSLPTAIATSTIVATQVPLPQIDNALLADMEAIAIKWAAGVELLDAGNTGVWAYGSGAFLHPIALEIGAQAAYMIDGGRVLQADMSQLQATETILAPGDVVEGVRVLEPIDLALSPDVLRVLDRAGDVYRLNLLSGNWTLERYERPVESSSGHYYMAVAADDLEVESAETSATLLEANYKFVSKYGSDSTSLWNLVEARAVDVDVIRERTYVLQRAMQGPEGMVSLYEDTRQDKSFSPVFPIEQPLQLAASERSLFVLDQNGRRLVELDPQSGVLLRLWQLPPEGVSAFWADSASRRLVFAGRDRLYFWSEPERLAAISHDGARSEIQPHDQQYLSSLDFFIVPIEGSNITFRDFQLPGAPRHYRLGVHHGFDLYWQPGTKVRAAADGIVVRADTSYAAPTALQLGDWWAETQELGYTPPEILDDYLGRQVWIQHPNGSTSRYAHLRAIEPAIEEGAVVERGQIIGEVGNSGSPSSLESESADAHLHYELWLDDDHYLGQYLRPIEVREWIERLFPPSR